MPRKKVPKRKLILYAGYDPSERNEPKGRPKSGPKSASGENVGTKTRRKPLGAYKRKEEA